MNFIEHSETIVGDLVALRRALHAAPETGLLVPDTQRAILDALSGLGLDVTTGTATTSVTAVLRGAHSGDTVLLRADMDALPMVEQTSDSFASTNGAMHACGHDLHMAGLVGAARLLAARRDELHGSVVFMFQPGEEGFGGAKVMIDEGVLDAGPDRPVAAFAIHVDSTTDLGTFHTRPGALMASANGMYITVTGSGGHAASPHLAVDPVPVAAEIVLALQSFAARRVPVTDPAVISVTALSTDSQAVNVLAKTVNLTLNIRTLSRETLALVREQLPPLVEAIGAAHGCTVAVEFVESYPVTFNDPIETERVLSTLRRLHGDANTRVLAAPTMASEDFAYVLDEVPGTLVFLGARPRELAAGDSVWMHAPTVVFDDSVLATQAATIAEIAWSRLHPVVP